MTISPKLKQFFIGLGISLTYAGVMLVLITQSFRLINIVRSYLFHFLIIAALILILGFLIAKFNKILAIILSLIAFGAFYFLFDLIFREEWCWLPAGEINHGIRYDVATEFLESSADQWSYVYTGFLYSSSCEDDFNTPKIALTYLFPTIKEQYDSQRLAELEALAVQSKQRDIQVFLSDETLDPQFTRRLDHSPADGSYTNYSYWFETANYAIEHSTWLNRIIRIQSRPEANFSGDQEYTTAELTQFAQDFFTRHHPYINEYEFSVESKSASESGSATAPHPSFNFIWKINHSHQNRHINLVLDQWGNILSYGDVTTPL